MIELKISGSTAEEIRNNVRELSIVLGLTGGQAPTKVEEVEQLEANTTQETPLEETNEPTTEEVTENDHHSSEEEEQDEVEDSQTEEAVTHTLEEVRSVARVLQQDGKMAFIKSVINAAGAERITEVDPQKYGWMLKCFETGEVIE